MAAAVAAPANGPPLAAPPAAPKDDALADLLPSEEDLLYEEELLRNPYSLRMWLRYLDARKSASPRKRYLLYERALNALPGSYKVRPAGREGALRLQHCARGRLLARCGAGRSDVGPASWSTRVRASRLGRHAAPTLQLSSAAAAALSL